MLIFKIYGRWISGPDLDLVYVPFLVKKGIYFFRFEYP